MRFGLFLNVQQPRGASMVKHLRDLLEQVRTARECGFDMVCTGQHYLSSPYQMFQTLPFLARVAAESGDMYLAATVILLSLQNPVDMAEQVATLDVICGGRFILGVGLGYREKEYQAFGVKPDQRVPRLLEALEVMKHLWTEEEWGFQGNYFQVPPTPLTTRPIQRPHPPIWVAANRNGAVKRAAQLGYPWLLNPHAKSETLEVQTSIYRRELKESGHPLPQDLPLMRELYISKDRKHALEECHSFLNDKYQVYAEWGQDKALPGRESFTLPFEELVRGRFIIGGPEDCVREIRQYQQRLGVNWMIFRIQWPGMENRQVLKEIRLLGEYVFPTFKAQR